MAFGIILFSSRCAHASSKPDPNQWSTVFEKEDGNAAYIDLKTATISTETDGHHITFWGQGVETEDGKQKDSFLGRTDINLSRQTFQDLNYIEFDDKGGVIRRNTWEPDGKKHSPIKRESMMWLMYEMGLEHFVRKKILPADGITRFENPDSEQWVKPLNIEGEGYVDVKNVTFPMEEDGPHAIFWHLKDPSKEDQKRYTLFNIDINLITRTERLMVCLEYNEKGEVENGISWSSEENELEPIGYGSMLWGMYQVVLGRYAAERVIPNEGAIAFKRPNPERWHLIGEFGSGVACYVDRKNNVFFETPEGDCAVFWYQIIPSDPKEFKTRLLARHMMNMTAKTCYVTDLIDFDEKGEVKKSYTYPPDEIKVQTILPDTTLWKIYEYVHARAEATRPKKENPKGKTEE